MSDNIESLGAHRADKTGDCRQWTPLDALRELVQQIEAGELNPSILYVAMYERLGDDAVDYRYKAAGGTKLELVGLLARHLHETNEGS